MALLRHGQMMRICECEISIYESSICFCGNVTHGKRQKSHLLPAGDRNTRLSRIIGTHQSYLQKGRVTKCINIRVAQLAVLEKFLLQV